MQGKQYHFARAGIVLVILALGFFFGMEMIAPKSNNPVAMMRIVGEVSGAGGALGVYLIVLGLIRRKPKT